MNLEDIVVSEISHKSWLTDTVWFHLDEGPRVVQFPATESEMVVSRDQGTGVGS